jgi:tRNA(fMet)-specific endonuclease VapC
VHVRCHAGRSGALVRYPANAAICRRYVRQATQLRDKGRPIGSNDLRIACHALAEDATLVTHNTREFARMTGLRIDDGVAMP